MAATSSLGPTVHTLAARVLAQQAGHLTALLKQAHDLFEQPTDNTPARADLDYINSQHEKDDLLGLRWWAHRATVLNITAANEHVLGLKAVLADEELLPMPAMALARSAYEAIINTYWLIDVDAVTEQRLARWAGRLLHDGQEPTAALKSFGEAVASAAEHQHVVEARSLGQNLMTRAGFELKAKGGDRYEETAKVTYRGENSTLTPNVTELAIRFTPTSNLWHMFSGATHSRGWLISGLEGSEELIVASILLPLLETSDALTYEVSRYFGLSPRPTMERTHLHRTALLRRAQPTESLVAGLDMYRQASGLTPLPKP